MALRILYQCVGTQMAVCMWPAPTLIRRSSQECKVMIRSSLCVIRTATVELTNRRSSRMNFVSPPGWKSAQIASISGRGPSCSRCAIRQATGMQMSDALCSPVSATAIHTKPATLLCGVRVVNCGGVKATGLNLEWKLPSVFLHCFKLGYFAFVQTN